MKKKKSDVAVIILLIALATLLLYVSMSVLGNGEKVVENAADLCNTADHTYFTSPEGAKIAEEIWNEMDEVEDYEVSPILYLPTANYYGDKNKENRDYAFMLSSIEEERSINKKNIYEQGELKENSIILPYSISVNEGYEIGDIFCIEISGKNYEFEIMGFAEDPLFATALNISIYRIYVTAEYVDRIVAANSIEEKLQYTECRAVLKEEVDIDDYTSKFVGIMEGRDKDSIIGILGDSMKGGVMMMPNILMGIVLVFSVVLILIAVIIMRFSVKNFIEDNLKNIGILQACGYTSSELRRATIMEMGLIGVTGVVIGMILSICGQGVVGNIQAAMMGLRYNVGVDVARAVMTVALIMGIVIVITFLNSRPYKHINVLDALRGGIHTHNFKKNVIPLHKTKLPVNVAVGAKYIFGAKFKNMGIFIIVAILSFASCIGFAMYENFAVDREFMLNLVGAELGTAITSNENPDEMGENIESWDVVEKVGYYASIDVVVSSGDESKTITCDAWKEPEKLENIMVIDGSLPKYDNEVVISTVVRDYFDVKVGDVIYLQGDGDSMEFIVSGVHQMINNMGQKIMLNYEGVKRLNSLDAVKSLQIYIYANEGYGYQDIMDLMEEHYPGIPVAESEKMADEALGIVAMTMEMICILFVGMTVVVVFLVVFLIIRSKIVSDKKNNGIYKAMGYTTKNLMIQTTMSNLPVVFTGAIAGAILSIFGSSPLAKMCLSFCGIEKCDVNLSSIYLVGTVIGITLVAWAVAMFVSSRIRKVEPVKMLTEE